MQGHGTSYEYRVVPAPQQGRKARGLKTTADRFANALQELMNELGAEGWEYLRADTLPCEERSGLTGRTTTYQNMLVFRRALVTEAAATPQVADLLAAPVAASASEPAPAPEQMPEPAPTPPVATPAAVRSAPPVTAPAPRTAPAPAATRGEAPTSAMSGAARAAAAALRTYRTDRQASSADAPAADTPDRKDPGVAAQ